MNILMNDHLSASEVQGRDELRKEERRKSADKWIYLLQSLAITSWGLFFIALLISYSTSPENNAGLNFYIINTNQAWVWSLNNYLYEILWSSAFTSYLCILLAKHRSRRKKDSKHFNIFMLFVVVFSWATYVLASI